MRATQHLRALLSASEPVIAVGAHDALSAKLVVAAGFEVVWASGFGISTVNAVPDANILTMTEMLEAVKRMLAAVDVPIIADCDSGYGNAINTMRTVREFSRQGVAGICLEDNVFPKRCSFYSSVRRELVPRRSTRTRSAPRRAPRSIRTSSSSLAPRRSSPARAWNRRCTAPAPTPRRAPTRSWSTPNRATSRSCASSPATGAASARWYRCRPPTAA